MLQVGATGIEGRKELSKASKTTALKLYGSQLREYTVVASAQ
jgi:hypothetical protein